MLHIGKNTRSRIVSKGISAGKSRNAYRGLVQIQPTATGARNHSQCDSMLIGDTAAANTYPYITVRAGPNVLTSLPPDNQDCVFRTVEEDIPIIPLNTDMFSEF